MLVKNIIKKCAEFLKLNNVIDYLNEKDVTMRDGVSEDIGMLVMAVNMVNNNIASSYMDLIGSNIINCDIDVIVPFSTISTYQIIDIKSVKTSGGENVVFHILSTGVKVDNVGRFEFTYSYFPSEVTIDSDINYYLKINELTFALGVVGEFLFLRGDIEEAAIWDKRFKQNLFNLVRPRRDVVMPKRGWE